MSSDTESERGSSGPPDDRSADPPPRSSVDPPNSTAVAAPPADDVMLFGTGRPLDPTAEYCGATVKGPLLFFCGGLFAFALVFGLYDAAAIDLLGLLCLLPSVVLALLVYVRRRDTIPLRQLFVRYVFAFLLLGCLWWFGLFWIIMLIYVLYAAVLWHLGIVGTVLTVVLLYGSIIVLEEGMKLILVRSQDNLAALPRAPLYPAYSAATALGLGSSISFTVVLFLRRIIDESSCKNCHLSPLEVVVMVVFCCALLQPIQLLSSYHLGLASARQHVLKQNVATGPQFLRVVVFRTGCLMSFITLLPIFPWLALFATLVLTGAYFVLVKRFEAQMPRQYLLAVGSLTTFGYGMIGGDEEEMAASTQGMAMDPPDQQQAPAAAVAVDIAPTKPAPPLPPSPATAADTTTAPAEGSPSQ